MEEKTKQFIELYTQYLEGVKRLSTKERDEILKVLLMYKKKNEKTYEKPI